MISKSQLAIGASLLFALLCSCGNQESVTGRVDVLRRGLSGEPSTLDPAAAADNFST
jgi:ABC-type oligopeptide transport system substrate-binding subunit